MSGGHRARPGFTKAVICSGSMLFGGTSCGDDVSTFAQTGGSTATTSSTATSTATASSTLTASSTSGGVDPDLDGAFAVETSVRDFVSPITTRTIHLDAYLPADVAQASVPLLFATETDVPPGSYARLARRIASHGLATFVTRYEVDAGTPNHVRNATDLLSALDFIRADATYAAAVDPARVAFGGHGLGAKIAVLAARSSEGVAALVLVDPVDHVGGCMPQYCPDGPSVLAQVSAPSLIFGDTEDGATCAPAAEGFETFFARAASPALRVIGNGASLMSFVDDREECGAPCAACAPSAADDPTIAAMTRALAVAHLLVHVEGQAAALPYLSGDVAEARYVTTGVASIHAQ